jgi:hypothetical protein
VLVRATGVLAFLRGYMLLMQLLYHLKLSAISRQHYFTAKTPRSAKVAKVPIFVRVMDARADS